MDIPETIHTSGVKATKWQIRAPNVERSLNGFFFSPNLIVSEYMWTGTAWIGASECPQCITGIGFLAATSQFLYAMENSVAGTPAKLRVGFNSAGTPGGLTEAAQVNGAWQLAILT
ncbi:hypothetical protein C8J56DRAFT_1050831 [Mycena floridula]|nr:hypothetical protein C8J56DRAFT_1050831 [Mycena floridula]